VFDVWVTTNSTWAARVGATEKTKAEAQLLVDNAVSGTYYMEGALSGSAVSGTIVLP
jgi:hypothetical protein